MNLYEVVLVG